MSVPSIWLRRIHKWVGILIGLQFLLWAISGTAMALLDMERVAEMRTAMAELGDEYKVSFNDIVLKAVAAALAQHPECNAHWLGDAMRYWNRVHLGIAVATETGLITPVIFDANLKRLSEIAKEARELAGRARERRLKPDEYTGSTFTVSNLGMFGIDHFTAIINPPEGAMLSINRSFSAPVNMHVDRAPGELEALATSDDDPFARYEAIQDLAYRVLVEGGDAGPLVAAFGSTLTSNALDPAFKGEALTLPSESLIAERFERADPDLIHQRREALRQAIGEALAGPLAEAQAATAPGADLSVTAKGVRRLRTVALSLLSAGDAQRGAGLAKAQYDSADNMTDRQGALGILISLALVISNPTPVAELDMGKLKGEPSRLAWSPDGSQLYLQTLEGGFGRPNAKLRHYVFSAATGATSWLCARR